MEIAFSFFPSDWTEETKLPASLETARASQLCKFFYNEGRIYLVKHCHIRSILDNPELFGFSKEELRAIYRQYSEPLGYEGKARKEIIIKAFARGWVRIGVHSDDAEGYKVVFNYDGSATSATTLDALEMTLKEAGFIQGHTVVRLPAGTEEGA